jgi:putative flippase GtrA
MRCFWKYFVAGMVSLAAHISILQALLATLSPPAVVATSIGFCAGTTINFILQHTLVFASDQPMFATARRYAAMTFVMIAVNALLFSFVNLVVGLPPSPAQLAATACTFLGNFLCSRHFTFASRLIPESRLA